ncbi:MAG: glycosyltransferase family 39 protein [bacterium]|nr:glycosyltransferase family 39 protein [bacterium]
MILTGLIVGLYAYALFFFGIIGILTRQAAIGLSLVSIIALVPIAISSLGKGYSFISALFSPKYFRALLYLVLIVLMASVNLAGALGPEVAFDSLWYHLVLPKLYLLSNTMTFVPGGLLYYSAMPKLGELMYTGGLSFGSEVFPKLISWGAGLLVVGVIYKIARMYINREYSLLACVIFYANLVVGWESSSAYVDLLVAFFVSLSMYCFFSFLKNKQKMFFFFSAVFVGLSISTKLLSLGTLLLFVLSIVFFFRLRKSDYMITKRDTLSFILLSLLLPLPWFLFSLMHTGNPVYPFFTSMYQVAANLQISNFFQSIYDFIRLFLFAPDPLSPIYIMSVPLVFSLLRRYSRQESVLLFFVALSIIIMYLIPRTGGSRFFLPYLPLLSVFVAMSVKKLMEVKSTTNVAHLVEISAVCILFVSIVYRGVANAKYLPVIFGSETKGQFLTKHLNFNFADFYDTDGYFTSNITKNDRVLLYGFHNLYYVDFPFIDQSFVAKGDRFNYIATQHADLPMRFSWMKKIYNNQKTGVTLYGDKNIWLNY